MMKIKEFVCIINFLIVSQYLLVIEAKNKLDITALKSEEATLGTLGSVLGPVLGLVTEAEYNAMLAKIMAILEDQKNFTGIVDKQSTKSQADFQRVDNRIDRQNDQLQEMRAKMSEMSSSLKNILLFQKAFAEIQKLNTDLTKLDDKLDNYSKVLDSIINALNKGNGVTTTEKTPKSA